MEKPNDIKSLFSRYVQNRATPEEIARLYAYFQAPDQEEELTTHILDALERSNAMDPQILARIQLITERLEEPLLEKAFQPDREIKRIRPWISYAAAILLLCVTGWAISWMLNKETPSMSQTSESLADLQPGTNRAILSLADGHTISLNEEQTGIRLGKDGIVYLDAVTPVFGWGDRESTDIQTLSTPRGGTYSIMLSDSTIVWLNAASSLRFPGSFTGEERVVELEGEAYFDVASRPDGQKFLVKTSSHTVEVTGTRFNVKAYPDEPEAQTTLVSGGVHILPSPDGTGDRTQVTLQPREQATIRGGRIQVGQVETEPYTAWRDGRFSFEGKTLEEVSREIGRWYAIDIHYEDIPPPEMKLFGDAHRDQDITFFIKLLESGGYDHELNGRTLTLKRKEGSQQ